MVSNFYSPMTLSPEERAVVESWSAAVRKRFEDKAGKFEFIDRMCLAEAEATAFSQIVFELRKR